jgi:hypothetical protein
VRFETDVSGLRIGPIFKDQTVSTAWPLKIGKIGSPQTSVSNRVKTLKTEEIKCLSSLFSATLAMESRLFRNVGNISSQYGVLSENAEIPLKWNWHHFARLLGDSAV